MPVRWKGQTRRHMVYLPIFKQLHEFHFIYSGLSYVQQQPQCDKVELSNGTEFTSRAFDGLAWCHGVKLDCTLPGQPSGSVPVKSFNGRWAISSCLSMSSLRCRARGRSCRFRGMATTIAACTAFVIGVITSVRRLRSDQDRGGSSLPYRRHWSSSLQSSFGGAVIYNFWCCRLAVRCTTMDSVFIVS
jgi:hypothetical protein